MTDIDRQNDLASVVELARMRHSLRELSGEVEALLNDAIRLAHVSGLSQAIIAEAAAVTRGRVSQIVKGGDATLNRSELSSAAMKLSDWPDKALRRHEATFTGLMPLPPYPRRRNSVGQ